MARPEAYGLRVCNNVFSAKLLTEANMALVAEYLRGNLGKFPATIARPQVPTCSVMIFQKNGSFNVVGASHYSDALLASYLIIEELRKINIFPFLCDTEVENVVCSASLGHFINLAAIVKDFPLRCNYSEDVFGGIHFTWKRDYTNREGKKPNTTVVIIFSTGRIVITGGKTRDSIAETLKGILPLLRHYRCADLPASAKKCSIQNEEDLQKFTDELVTREAVEKQETKRKRTTAARSNQRKKRYKPSVGYAKKKS